MRENAHCFRLPINASGLVIHLHLTQISGRRFASPKTGLSPDASYNASYLRPDEHQPRPLILLSDGTADGAFGFREFDSQQLPGLYGLQIPANFLRPGFTHVCIRFEDARPCFIRLQGVSYDPYDGSTMNLGTWVLSNCHENLTSGIRMSLPRTLRPHLNLASADNYRS